MEIRENCVGENHKYVFIGTSFYPNRMVCKKCGHESLGDFDEYKYKLMMEHSQKRLNNS